MKKKYKATLAEFEKNLPSDGNVQLHEDYGEWSYLEAVAKAIGDDIEKYHRLNGAG